MSLVLEAKHFSLSLQFIIQIKDLNDNKPIMKPNSCELDPIKVLEDNGSGSMNSTPVYTIQATDADKESK